MVVVSIAPMMKYSDRHFRYFFRLLTKKTTLYTEMVSENQLLNSKIPPDRFLFLNECEHPVAVQLGGSCAKNLALAAAECEKWGFDEINLNVGCPSPRVTVVLIFLPLLFFF